MSKSLGNFITVQQLSEDGYDPLALRYLILTSHYRKGLNYSTESLESAQIALNNLRQFVVSARSNHNRTCLSDEKLKKVEKYSERFLNAINDDINTPQALAVLWEAMKSNIPSEDKYDLAISFDEVLGLGLRTVDSEQWIVNSEIQDMIKKREDLRKEKRWDEADRIRNEIDKLGFEILDTEEGTKLKAKS